jgi:hypothetical protein
MGRSLVKVEAEAEVLPRPLPRLGGGGMGSVVDSLSMVVIRVLRACKIVSSRSGFLR